MLLFLLSLLVACQTAPTASPPNLTVTATAVDNTSSNANPLETKVEGQLVPRQFATLSFASSGKVTEILVQKGSFVAVGDPLVQLDQTELLIQQQQAQAQLHSAQAALTAVQIEQQLAQAAIEVAQAQVIQAEANLALIQSGPHPEEIEEAQSRLAAAEAGVVEAIGRRDSTLYDNSNVLIEAAEANVAAVVADLQAIESAYDQVLTSCYDTPEGEVCPMYGPVEETLRAQLQAAELRRAAAQAELDELLGGPTAVQQQNSNSAVALAMANRDVVEAELNLLLEAASPTEIEQAQIQVSQAEVMVATAEVGVARADALVQQAEAAIVVAEANVTAVATAVERTIIRATIAGQVADILVSPNETIAPNQPVIVLADFSDWVVQTKDLSELDVARLAVDADVSIDMSAIPDAVLSGQVEKIALVGQQLQGEIVYEAIISVDPAPHLPLRWGMTVFISSR